MSILLNTACSKKKQFKVKLITNTTLDAAWDSLGKGVPTMERKRLKNFQIARQNISRITEINTLMTGYGFSVLTKQNAISTHKNI